MPYVRTRGKSTISIRPSNHLTLNPQVESWDQGMDAELLNPVPVLGTNIVQLTKSGTDLRLVLNTTTTTSNPDTNLVLQDMPTQPDTHLCASVETFWILEHDTTDGVFSGELVTDETPVQLRHFLTGEYAQLPGNAKKVIIKPALEATDDDEVVWFKSGAHVQLTTDKGYIGSVDDRRVVLKPEFNFNDTITLRKVDNAGKTDAIKVLGLKLVLSRILRKDSDYNNFSMTKNNHRTICDAMDDIGCLLETRKQISEDFISFGIVDMLFELSKLYLNAKIKTIGIVFSLDAVCKLLNTMSQMKSFVARYDDKTSELINTLVGDGQLLVAIRQPGDDRDDEQDSSLGEKTAVVSPLNSFLYRSPYLLATIAKEVVKKLVGAFEHSTDRMQKREIAKILCSLCRIRGKTVPTNQKIIAELLFKDGTRSPALLKHAIKDSAIFYDDIPITEISSTSDIYEDLLSQLQLYECLLFGKRLDCVCETQKKFVSTYNMYTLEECTKVITDQKVDSNIKGWYVQILIATHVDTGFADTKLIPCMLTFTYEENIGNRANICAGGGAPPVKSEKYYQLLLTELEQFLRRNKTCTVNDHDSSRSNMYRYHMVRLLEYMFRAGKINYKNERRFITPLIDFLNGTSDMYSGKSAGGLDNEKNEKTFQEIFRFKTLEVNQPVFDIKKRALRALYYAYEHALFSYWTQVMNEVYSNVKYYHENKEEWLSKIGNFLGKFDFKVSFHEVIVQVFEDPNFDMSSKKSYEAKKTIKSFLLEKFDGIELFNQMEFVVSN